MNWPPPYLERAGGPVERTSSLNILCLAEYHNLQSSVNALLVLLQRMPALRDTRNKDTGASARLNAVIAERSRRTKDVSIDTMDVPTMAVVHYVLDGLKYLNPRGAAMLESLALSALNVTLDKFGSILRRWRARLFRRAVEAASHQVADELQGYGLAIDGVTDLQQAAMLCVESLVPIWGIVAAFEEALWRQKDFATFEDAIALRERRFIAARNHLLDGSWSDADYQRLIIPLYAAVHLVNSGPLTVAALRPEWLDRQSSLEIAAYWGLERLSASRRFLVEVDECHSTIHSNHSLSSGSATTELFASLAQVWSSSGMLAARQSLIERRSLDLLPRYLFESIRERLRNADSAELAAAADGESHNLVDTSLHEFWHMITAAWPGHPELANEASASPSIGYTVVDGRAGPIIMARAAGHGFRGFYQAAGRAGGSFIRVGAGDAAGEMMTQREIGLALAEAYLAEDQYDRVVDLARTILNQDLSEAHDSANISGLVENKAFYELKLGRMEGAKAAFATMLTICSDSGNDLGRLRARNGIAGLMAAEGDSVGALALCQRNLRDSLELLGTDHIWTTVCRVAVATYYMRMGDFDKAVAEYEEVVRVRDQQLGPDAGETLKARVELAIALHGRGDTYRAKEMLRASLLTSEAALGSDAYPSRLARSWLRRIDPPARPAS
jgi:tetratricopeptide (TPR) repeat protein